MKTKIILSFLLFIGVSFRLNAQTLKKTYYDWRKTEVAEAFYVNAKGEKNGSYTKYAENGIIEETATYKNGLLNGVYTKYATVTGRQQIISKETYVEDVRNGEATYYAGDGNVLSQGKMINDKREGKWIKMEDYNNIMANPPKGFEWVKGEVTFRNDQLVMDGKVDSYFYPSGKLQGKRNYINGVQVDTNITYFPNGQIESRSIYNSKGGTIDEKVWWENGQVKVHDWAENGTLQYEGYNQDGSPDNVMMDQANKKRNEEQKAKEAKLRYDNGIKLGDALFAKQDYSGAKQAYRDAAYQVTSSHYNPDDNNHAGRMLGLIDSLTTNQAKQQEDLGQITDNIYKKNWIVVKKYCSLSLIQGPGLLTPEQSVISIDKKRRIYEALFPILYKPMIGTFQSEQDMQKKLDEGNQILKLLDIADRLLDSDTKDIEKQLKNAKTPDEIKQIVGL